MISFEAIGVSLVSPEMVPKGAFCVGGRRRRFSRKPAAAIYPSKPRRYAAYDYC